MNNWKKIWEKRELRAEVLDKADKNELFAELKRCNGFDVVGGIPLDSLIKQYNTTKDKLLQYGPSSRSIYEVGCGSGANLFMFAQDGWRVGGLDYSNALISIAEKVLDTDDLLCAEAAYTPEEPKYDCLLSNSVFSYFESYDYALAVLERMYNKANSAIALIDIHDIEKKDAYHAFRKAEIEDYEERYRDLPKLFYSRKLFEDFAAGHDMQLEFYSCDMEGYWNDDFTFHLIMSKNK
ncbi:MAG: class I SAM-dependent methyltransferase [Ruminococcus sp.]|nr:class I SAM-dependent methyltransferase [Ruminococcus sp.]